MEIAGSYPVVSICVVKSAKNILTMPKLIQEWLASPFSFPTLVSGAI